MRQKKAHGWGTRHLWMSEKSEAPSTLLRFVQNDKLFVIADDTAISKCDFQRG
jgi:hypothetical protein